MLKKVLQKIKNTQAVTPQERKVFIDYLMTKDHNDRLDMLEDPWAFMIACAYSIDEKSDTDKTVKPAPTDKDYIAEAVRQWKEEDMILVNKSRQLWFSWLYVTLCLHHVMFKTDQKVFFVSEKTEKADALIERAKAVHSNIPEEIWPKELQPKMVRVENFMKFPDIGCAIQALPSGKDQMRSFTGSIVFDDEGGFWPDAEETIAAQIPATKKLVAVSTIPESFTAEPVFWWKLCFDLTDGVISEKEVKQLMKGMKRWKNPNNQFSVLEVHFSSDPAKDNAEWIRWSQRGYTDKKKWEREVNMKWTKSSGTPVYGEEFNADFHICKGYEPDPNFEIIRAWDFGFNQCAVFGQFVGGKLYIFDEVTAEKYFPGETHVGTKRFAPFIKEYSEMNYKSFHFIDVVDPAGNAHEQGSEDRIIKPMRDVGLKPILGEKLFEVRRETVLQLLTRNKQGRPSLMVDPENCPTVYGGFLGGYQYPEAKGKTAVRPDRPLKNKWSHTMDCVQYLACYSLKLARHARGFNFLGVTVPDMTYSFTDD